MKSPLAQLRPACRAAGLAEVAAQLDHAQPRLGSDQLLRHPERIVRAAIVHKNDLRSIARLKLVADCADAADELRQRRPLRCRSGPRC